MPNSAPSLKSCDPVVVEGDYAYVTLRAGNLCGEATSQLDIIDVSNISSPEWEQSYPMQEPYGLGIDNSILFICDGEAGLKVYDANDPHDLIKIAWFPEVRAFDVIPYNGLLTPYSPKLSKNSSITSIISASSRSRPSASKLAGTRP